MLVSNKFTKANSRLNVHDYDILISGNSKDLEKYIRFHNKPGGAVRTDVGHLALNTFTNPFVHKKWE